MFRRARKRQDILLPDIDYGDLDEVEDSVGKREESISRNMMAHRQAEQMHTDSRNPRVKSLIAAKRRSDNARALAADSRSTGFDPDRGKNTVPYRPAIGAMSRPPVPPSPSSGASPRIAGKAASSILRGTGALGVVGGVVGLALGMSDPAEALGATVDRAGGTGAWARKKFSKQISEERAYYAKKRAQQRASSPLTALLDRRRNAR